MLDVVTGEAPEDRLGLGRAETQCRGVLDHLVRLPTTSQGQHRRRPEEAFEPVVVEADAKVMTNELRGDGVEHLAQDEAACRCDPHPRLLVVARSTLRQLVEQRALDFEPLAVLGVVAPDDLVDEPAVGGKILEVARAAQQQCILDGLLEMAVRTLD